MVADTSPMPTTAPSRRATAIRLENVNKTYGASTVLNEVSLDIYDGEFFTLLGPSGSGKTTVLRIIAGLLEPDNGIVEIGGTSVVGTPAYKRDLAVVFQSLALFPHLTVGENVAFPLRMRRVPKQKRLELIQDALALVQLPDIANRAISELSGGQRQRVALARALVYRPRILLLDEPLSALDRRLRESMQLELTRIHRELGVTIVNVTHDQREAMIVSDRVAVMEAGRVVQCASGAELYERPSTNFVASFLGDPLLLEGEVVAGPAGEKQLVCRCGTLRVPPTTGVGHATAVLRPERLSLSPANDAGGSFENALDGVVLFATFDGAGVFYQVSLDSGDTVAVHVSAKASARAHQIGEPVRVTWDAADVPIVTGA